MFTRTLTPFAFYRRGQRLAGVVTLLVYVSMTMGLPVGYSGTAECNCACSTNLKSAGKCCCHLPRTGAAPKSCCATNSPTVTATVTPTVAANEVCGPAEVSAYCVSHDANTESTAAIPAYCRDKSATPTEHHKSPLSPDGDTKAPPVLTSCGCDGAAPSGILNSSEPRILFPRADLVSGQELAWSLSVSLEAPPEWNLPPETPPPEAV